MELKEFISSTLQQICEAIVEAQLKTKPSGAVISPRCNILESGAIHIATSGDPIERASSIRFDVALTAATTDGANKTGEKHALVQVASFVKIGGSISSGKKDTHQHEQSSISRVQFEIPVLWPMTSADKQASALRVSPRQEHAITDYDPLSYR